MKLLDLQELTLMVSAPHPFSLRQVKKPVLRGVSLSVSSGEAVAVVGQSGGGKSTLARCIAGLQKPDAGRIIFDGLEIFPREKHRKRFPLDIQLIFQASAASLDPMMSIEEILLEGVTARQEARRTEARAILTHLLEMVGLEPVMLARLPSQLSGGERQRIAIARALAAEPRFLILDEPTSALDVVTQQQILLLLRRLRQARRLTMLFVTHDLAVALQLCDRIAVLHDGIIVEDAPARELISAPQHPFTRRLVHDFRSWS